MEGIYTKYFYGIIIAYIKYGVGCVWGRGFINTTLYEAINFDRLARVTCNPSRSRLWSGTATSSEKGDRFATESRSFANIRSGFVR